jgi:hypothetical protein
LDDLDDLDLAELNLITFDLLVEDDADIDVIADDCRDDFDVDVDIDEDEGIVEEIDETAEGDAE